MKGYILSMLFGLMTLPIVTHMAYHQRGYKAIGGEYLVPILVVLGYALYRDLKTKRKSRFERATIESIQG